MLPTILAYGAPDMYSFSFLDFSDKVEDNMK
jgi:hypothetical protein